MTEAKDAIADFTPPAGGDPVLTVTVTGTGNVKSNPAGIDCGIGGTTSPCTKSYTSGTDVTLAAVPIAPATTVSWTGCATQTALTCTVKMDASKAVTAAFSTAAVPAASPIVKTRFF
jgi:hypothetical protein